MQHELEGTNLARGTGTALHRALRTVMCAHLYIAENEVSRLQIPELTLSLLRSLT